MLLTSVLFSFFRGKIRCKISAENYTYSFTHYKILLFQKCFLFNKYLILRNVFLQCQKILTDMLCYILRCILFCFQWDKSQAFSHKSLCNHSLAFPNPQTLWIIFKQNILDFTCFHVKSKEIKCRGTALSTHSHRSILLIGFSYKIGQDLRIFSVMICVSNLKWMLKPDRFFPGFGLILFTLLWWMYSLDLKAAEV